MKIEDVLSTQQKTAEKLLQNTPQILGVERILPQQPELPKQIARIVPEHGVGKGRERGR